MPRNMQDFTQGTNNSYTGVPSVDSKVKQIRDSRKAEAASNSPESKGRWTDSTRLQ